MMDNANITYNPGGYDPGAADENVAESVAVPVEPEVANETALREGLQVLIDTALTRQTEMQALLDTANATINGSPASHIKALARATKRQDRALIRLVRLVGGLTSSADTGAD